MTVETNVYFLTLCDGLRGCVGRTLKPIMIALDGCQTDVGLVDRTNTAVDDLDYDFLVGRLHQALFYCLDRTLYVCLDDQWKFLYISCLDLGEQIQESQLTLYLQCLFLLSEIKVSAKLCLFSFSAVQIPAGVRHVIKTQNLDRSGRTSLFDAASLSSIIARTRGQQAPAAIGSPTCRVPFIPGRSQPDLYPYPARLDDKTSHTVRVCL